jgi:AraC family transcriptional activator of pobA
VETTTLEQFYKQLSGSDGGEDGPGYLLPDGITREIGHFNVFKIDELVRKISERPVMPYNRRAYYKISLIKGHNRAEYADKVIEIPHSALLFATPAHPL